MLIYDDNHHGDPRDQDRDAVSHRRRRTSVSGRYTSIKNNSNRNDDDDDSDDDDETSQPIGGIETQLQAHLQETQLGDFETASSASRLHLSTIGNTKSNSKKSHSGMGDSTVVGAPIDVPNWTLVAIVKRKIVFSKRPMPVLNRPPDAGAVLTK